MRVSGCTRQWDRGLGRPVCAAVSYCPVIITKFNEILTGLDEALEFAKSLPVKVAGSRFELYRDPIAAWVEKHIPERSLPPDRDDGLDYIALSESMELAQDIVPCLRGEDPKIAKEKLGHIFRGKHKPGEDDHNESMARNIAFEVAFAAVCRRAGLDTRLEEPDVVVRLGQRKILIACKRPFGAPGVEANITGARDQIEKHLTPSGDRGAIAISLSRVVVPLDTWLRGRDAADLDRQLDARVVQGVERHRHHCQEHVPAAMVGGVIFHASCVGFEPKRYIYLGASRLYRLGTGKTASSRLFD